MTSSLRVPCSYQGGKQRVAAEIVDYLLQEVTDQDCHFYDLCCGSGAVSIELVNRGIKPERIVMLDGSPWGAFWSAIGSGEFDMHVFDNYLKGLPADKRQIKKYVEWLAAEPLNGNEAELYPLLQACSFGGKQIWSHNGRWENAFFRDFWEPTATSVRRSPANPMQPNATELKRRVNELSNKMRGVTGIRADIFSVLRAPLPGASIVYIDPPYKGTTGYGLGFDLNEFVDAYFEVNSASLFVSEGVALTNEAIRLNFGGAKGGISGTRDGRHEEWLSRFQSRPSLRA